MTIPLLLLSLLLASLSISAQVNPLCPVIKVDGPPAPQRDQLNSYTASVKPTESKLTYKWTVSSGEILKGQGTSSIQVRFGPNEVGPTAKVEIGGLPQECPNIASDSSSFESVPQARKLDTFSLPLRSGSDERIKSIAAALRNEPTTQLYVLVPTNRFLWKPLGDRLYELVHSDLTGPRITFVEVNGINKIVEVWLVPPGATPPSRCEACDQSKSTKKDCPTIFVNGMAGITVPGDTMTFTVNEPPGYKGSYKWALNHGTIESGQGTPSIVVRTPTHVKISSITATVKLSGLDATCSNSSSNTAPVTHRDPLELDEYGHLNPNEEKARLAMAVNYIRGRSPMKAVVVIRVPAKSATVTYASRRRTITTLLRELKAPKNRFVFIDAGKGELSTSIWIVPAEAVPAMIRGSDK